MRNGRKGDIRTCLFVWWFGCLLIWQNPIWKSGLRFRILPFTYGLLLMQNSHLSVLRQATPQSLERVASWKPRHIFITGSVYNSAAIYSFQKGRCGYSHIPCHLNHIGEGAVGRWKMGGRAKRWDRRGEGRKKDTPAVISSRIPYIRLWHSHRSAVEFSLYGYRKQNLCLLS